MGIYAIQAPITLPKCVQFAMSSLPIFPKQTQLQNITLAIHVATPTSSSLISPSPPNTPLPVDEAVPFGLL
jgi:hypothetical protein